MLLSLAPPVTWYQSGHAKLEAELAASALVKAAVISDRIALNPDLWQFETERLASLLMLGEVEDPEWRRVLAADGSVVADTQVVLSAPHVVVRRPMFDAGRIVGWVEARRSLVSLIRETALIALAALALGTAAFVALRVAPMRLLRRAVAHASHLASHDALTGLPNRAMLQDRLRQAAVDFKRRGGGAVAVLCLDLDHFKEVNDTLGHGAGDRLLSEVTLRFSACLRESDTVARLGGDEFAVLLTDITQPGDAAVLAERLREAVEQPFDLDGHQAVVSVSIGIAVAESSGSVDPARLMQEADLALYDAKAEGRNGYRFFASHMNATLQARRALEADLRAAMAGNELRLHFQPQVDLPSRRLTGAEALLRWEHPLRGNVPPDAFIGLAERTGLIIPLGAWVLEEACRQAMGWEQPLRVAVNVSVVQFRHAGFLGVVRRVLETTGLPPARLELEVTESLLLADTEEMLLTLNRLRDMGITIAMDDFGTGYSSLSYLRRFRFDKVKIDRGFVQGLGEDPSAAAIIRAIVGMAEALGIRANAEGVETEDQALRLGVEGCGELQGYLFGRPLEAAEFAALAQGARVSAAA